MAQTLAYKARKAGSMKRISQASLRSRFVLTPAEAQIALGIAEGKTLAAIAEMRNVAVSTARDQLKSVFAKTGTHRQAELVAFAGRAAPAHAQAITKRQCPSVFRLEVRSTMNKSKRRTPNGGV